MTEEVFTLELTHTLNIAHRGARSLAPENTLAAARRAYEIGADLWELDVAMTADGELLVIHDDTLERTSNVEDIFPERKPWNVSEFTLAEIRQLDFGSWFNEDDPFQQIKDGNVPLADQKSYVGEPAPTLRDALQFTLDHQWKVNIEIKSLVGTPGDKLVVSKVVSLVQERGMQDRVLISSFNHDYLVQVKTLDASIPTAALVSIGYPAPASLVERLNAQAYNPKLGEVTIQEISDLRQKGIDVYIWVVNEPEAMKRLIVAGASGLFTDYPQVLKEILDQRH
jgi:glycerophosphoryl diester phosphodiesterase